MKTITLALCLLFQVSNLLAQDLVFQLGYAVKTETMLNPKFTNSDSSEHEIPTPSVVSNSIQLFTDKSFSIYNKSNQITTYYDLPNQRHIRYDEDSIYQNVPIFHIIDYRQAEFSNRIFLSGMLGAGGLENGFGSPASLESLFGIEGEDKEVRKEIVLKKVKRDGEIYSYQGKELVKIIYGKEKIPAAYVDAFSKYLTYALAIHPYIKERIIKKKPHP